MKRSVVILTVIFIFILPILLTVYVFQTDTIGLIFVLSIVIFIQILIVYSFHDLPLFVQPTWMAEKKKFEGAEEVEEESKHINHEKVLGEIPSLVISKNFYKVYMITKKLIFEKTFRVYSPLSFLHSKLLINELSYANITRIEILRVYESYQIGTDGTKTYAASLNPYCLIIYGLTKGLIKKKKEKILIRGFLVPLSSYYSQKMSLGLNEIGVAREYAIEIRNLLSSVLKDKVLKAAEFEEKERRTKVAIGILVLVVGIMSTILGLGAITSDNILFGFLFLIFGILSIIVAIRGPILKGFTAKK